MDSVAGITSNANSAFKFEAVLFTTPLYSRVISRCRGIDGLTRVIKTLNW